MISMHVDEKSISFAAPNKLIHMGMLNKLVNDKIPSRAAQKSRHAPEQTRRDPRGFSPVRNADLAKPKAKPQDQRLKILNGLPHWERSFSTRFIKISMTRRNCTVWKDPSCAILSTVFACICRENFKSSEGSKAQQRLL